MSKPKKGKHPSPVGVAGNFTCEKVGTKCWGCGKKEVKGERRFRKCPKCDDLKLMPSFFCSDECYRENWPRHKAFHKEMKNKSTHYEMVTSLNSETLKEYEKILDDHKIGEQTLNAFEKAMAEGRTYLYKNDFANAKKKFRKAQKLNPNSPEVHGSLGSAYFSSGHVAEGLKLIAAGIERWAYNCLTGQSGEHNMFRSEKHMKNLFGFAHSIVWFIETMKGAMSQEVEYEQPDWFRDDFVMLRVIEFAKRLSQVADDLSQAVSNEMPGKEQVQRLHVWHGYTLIGYYHDGKVREGQPPLDRDFYHLEKAEQCFRKADDIQKEIDANRNTTRPVNGCMREHYHTIQLAQHVMMSANMRNLLPKEVSPFYKGCFVMVHGLTSNDTKTMNKKLGKVKTIDCGDGEVGILVDGFEEPKNLKLENVMVLPLSDREIALVSCLSTNDQWILLKPIVKQFLERLPDPN